MCPQLFCVLWAVEIAEVAFHAGLDSCADCWDATAEDVDWPKGALRNRLSIHLFFLFVGHKKTDTYFFGITSDSICFSLFSREAFSRTDSTGERCGGLPPRGSHLDGFFSIIGFFSLF